MLESPSILERFIMFKNVFIPILAHIAFSICMYFGFVEGIEGAQYIVKFYIWTVMFPISIILLISISQPKYVNSTIKRPVLLKHIVFVMHLLYMFTFVWYGHFVTALALMLSIITIRLYGIKHESK